MHIFIEYSKLLKHVAAGIQFIIYYTAPHKKSLTVSLAVFVILSGTVFVTIKFWCPENVKFDQHFHRLLASKATKQWLYTVFFDTSHHPVE